MIVKTLMITERTVERLIKNKRHIRCTHTKIICKRAIIYLLLLVFLFFLFIFAVGCLIAHTLGRFFFHKPFNFWCKMYKLTLNYYCCLDYCFRTHSGYFDKRSLALDKQTTSGYSDIDSTNIRYSHWSWTHTRYANYELVDISNWLVEKKTWKKL